MPDKPHFLLLCPLLLMLFAHFLNGQAEPGHLAAALTQDVQSPEIAEFQLRQHMTARIPRLAVPNSAAQWQAEASRIRKHLLEDVVYHGWPRAWVDAPPKAEDLGLIEVPAGRGYRVRKIRYEIVPGFQSTAILYEPEKLSGKAPAILNVNGHFNPHGKAIEWQQKRCINYARRGILALNVEWMGFGELRQPENHHDFGPHLDLAGANSVGLFYLAMRKALDYLSSHPQVDPSRIGMTGLSGGGWQTIVLSALDERIAVAVPVAGYGSLETNIVHPKDTSEIEEDATDLRAGQDYTHLTAMRAPRPTLLIYNAQDTCCFRAPMNKPVLYDAIRPFFQLFDKAELFRWYENSDPGTHNYQRDSREQSYEFFSRHFRLPVSRVELPVDAEILSPEELAVGLPGDNLTILDLARKLARENPRSGEPPESQRAALREIVRYKPLAVRQPWMVSNTRNLGVETQSYRLGMDDGLSATAVWLKAISIPEDSPITVMLHDGGRKELKEDAAGRANRGEQVLAVDLLFTGDAAPQKPTPADYALLLASIGERPIGIEVGQLIAASTWLRQNSGARRVRLEASGMRSQVAALIAAAIEPNLFWEVEVRQGIRSLGYLLDTPVKYRTAPDLFCLDLYKQFDVDTLARLAAPAKVRQAYAESSK